MNVLSILTHFLLLSQKRGKSSEDAVIYVAWSLIGSFVLDCVREVSVCFSALRFLFHSNQSPHISKFLLETRSGKLWNWNISSSSVFLWFRGFYHFNCGNFHAKRSLKCKTESKANVWLYWRINVTDSRRIVLEDSSICPRFRGC